MPQWIKTTVTHNIGTIALNHYEKRNALSVAVIDDILKTLDEWEKKAIKVIVLRQEGDHPVWSAGHDVDELPIADAEPLPYNDALMQLLRAVRKFPAPIIAMIHGSVWGGAFDLVVNCDMIMADETASFAITPAKLGLPYNASGIQHFLARLPINIVKELFFTANPIDAQRALNYHLINELVAPAELAQRTYELAETICTRSSQAIAAFKEQARLLIEATPVNPEVFEYIEQIRRDVYQGQDYHEGIQAFLAKRKPNFR